MRIFPDGTRRPGVRQLQARPTRGRIWSYLATRNIQGADLHPVTGEIWTVEHGPRGGDRVNAPKASKNTPYSRSSPMARTTAARRSAKGSRKRRGWSSHLLFRSGDRAGRRVSIVAISSRAGRTAS
ncbi:MAG: PQQ-dependent sugar dehydrogenase [Alphaproteobacteria bacterium]